MFKSYPDLISGYLEFYRDYLSAVDSGQQQHAKQIDSFACQQSPSSPSSSLIINETTPKAGSGFINANEEFKNLTATGGRQASDVCSQLCQKQSLTESCDASSRQTANPSIDNVRHDLISHQLDENNSPIKIGSFNNLSSTDLLYICVIFINFLLLKRCLSRWIKSSNYVKSLGLRPKDQERLDESVWRLIYYTFSSSWLVYSCFLKHSGQRLFDERAQFTEYVFSIDLDEYLICMIEAAFYLHATSAIVFEDVWRRDSPMMLVHHIAAIFSIIGVYSTRTHRIGLVAIVLRDTCDVLLEVTKISLCLRIRHGQVSTSTDKLVKFLLILFVASFVVNQLYYYPLFCLYHGFNMVKVHNLRTRTMLGILTCGLIFLLLDLLWFMLILRLLYRMLFTSEPLKDLREYDEDDDHDADAAAAAGHRPNEKSATGDDDAAAKEKRS